LIEVVSAIHRYRFFKRWPDMGSKVGHLRRLSPMPW
jgi:hypothetical protein